MDMTKPNSKPTYSDVHEATNNCLNRAEGLLYALEEMARDDNYLGTSEPLACAFMSMISCAHKQVKEASAAHDTEWKITKGLERDAA